MTITIPTLWFKISWLLKASYIFHLEPHTFTTAQNISGVVSMSEATDTYQYTHLSSP